MALICSRLGTLAVIVPVLGMISGCGATDNVTGPNTTSLEVVAFTVGFSDNLNYQVQVDSAMTQDLAPNGVFRLNDLKAGPHTVKLLGVGPDCTMAGQNPVVVNLTPADTIRVAFHVDCRFSAVQITTMTSGASLDGDGYVIMLDGVPGQAMGINDTLLLSRISYGAHVVRLDGLDWNCAVPGSSSRNVYVSGLGTLRIVFQVSCLSTTSGTIQVTTSTTGIAWDGDGYTLALDSGPAFAISPNGTLDFNDVPVGQHSLAVSGLAPNCLLSGPSVQAIGVPAAAITRVAFSIRCVLLGTILFNGYQAEVPHVYAMNASGTNVVDLTPAGESADGMWSPDGTRIVFWSYRGGNDEIYVMNADGSNPRNLTNSAAAEFSPAWSPDGTQIAFVANGGIYVMNADGSGRRLVVSTGGSPKWSPDGARIVFVRRNGVCSYFGCGTDLYVASVDGSNITNLTHNTTVSSFSGPAWSPDGSLIGYFMATGGLFFATRTIMVMNPDGSGQRTLFYGNAGPIWSPDGTAIATAGYVGNELEVKVQDVIRPSAAALFLTASTADNTPTSWR